ncbi:hypothetical protein K438DRAFT_2103479 [Mycena galopus ATCC 62051]|nr:hypothetical protein K438DRAFT_2103479 [Mycena galopus ATCC 62051]
MWRSAAKADGRLHESSSSAEGPERSGEDRNIKPEDDGDELKITGSHLVVVRMSSGDEPEVNRHRPGVDRKMTGGYRRVNRLTRVTRPVWEGVWWSYVHRSVMDDERKSDNHSEWPLLNDHTIVLSFWATLSFVWPTVLVLTASTIRQPSSERREGTNFRHHSTRNVKHSKVLLSLELSRDLESHSWAFWHPRVVHALNGLGSEIFAPLIWSRSSTFKVVFVRMFRKACYTVLWDGMDTMVLWANYGTATVFQIRVVGNAYWLPVMPGDRVNTNGEARLEKHPQGGTISAYTAVDRSGRTGCTAHRKLLDEPTSTWGCNIQRCFESLCDWELRGSTILLCFDFLLRDVYRSVAQLMQYRLFPQEYLSINNTFPPTGDACKLEAQICAPPTASMHIASLCASRQMGMSEQLESRAAEKF